MLENQRVILNVGGVKHETLWKTLNKIPNSRLGQLGNITNSKNLYNLCDDFNEEKNEYFFDRDPTLFSCILNYYRIGKLHISDDICPILLDSELLYWSLKEPRIDLCCEEKLFKKQKDIDFSIRKYQKIIKEEMLNLDEDRKINSSKFSVWKKAISFSIDNPFHTNSSNLSKIFGVFSVLFLILSTINLVIGTLPMVNKRNLTNDFQLENSTQHHGIIQYETYLNLIEGICIVWFTFEFLIRLLTVTNLKKFMFDLLNIVDLLCILPFYFGIFLNEYQFFKKVKHLFQMLRVLRLLKLGRYSTGIKSFAYALKISSKNLSYLVLLLFMNVLLFGSFVYFAEQENPDTIFTSILSACWYTIITTTTVGYGDMYPVTPLGKLIGSFCAIIGIIMFALPLAVISNNFGEYEKHFERRQKVINSLRPKEESQMLNKTKQNRALNEIGSIENTETEILN